MYNNYFISKRGKKNLVFTSLFVAFCFSSGVGVLGADYKSFVDDLIKYAENYLDSDATQESKDAAGTKALSSLLGVKSVASKKAKGVQLTTSRAASIADIAKEKEDVLGQFRRLSIDNNKAKTSVKIKGAKACVSIKGPNGAKTSCKELASLTDYEELDPNLRSELKQYRQAVASHNFDGQSGKGLILAYLLAGSLLAYEYYEGKISAKKRGLAIWSAGGAALGGLFFAAIPQINMLNSRFGRTAETWLKFDSFIGAGGKLSLEFGLNGAILGAAVGLLAYEGYERVYKPNFGTSGGYSLTTKIAVATAGVLVVGAALFYESILEAFYGEESKDQDFE